MKYGKIIGKDGKEYIVDAAGNIMNAGEGDVDFPMLHILPALHVPVEYLSKQGEGKGEGSSGVDCSKVKLHIRSDLPGSLIPEGGLRIAQPYPNRCYFVGGSALNRNGWMVPLPLEVNEFMIEMMWEIGNLRETLGQDDWTVLHKLHFMLLPGTGQTYTMDATCWNDGAPVPPLQRQPRACLGLTDQCRVNHSHRTITGESMMVNADGNAVGYIIEETLRIAGIPLDQVWTANEFTEEQLHEVVQLSSIQSGVEKHRANASVVMPSSLLVEAIQQARRIRFDSDSAFHAVNNTPGGLENHPALLLLAEWWDHLHPGNPYKTGYCIPFVRLRDDGEYWCADSDHPNVAVDGWNPGGKNAAIVNDLILLMFVAKQESAKFDDKTMSLYFPDGQDFMTIGITQEEWSTGNYDDAFYSLRALYSFPERFPVAWAALNNKGVVR